ncbi:hypothetical protein IscW_ISCW014917, partial [Ixodes scapularis]
LIHVAVLAKKSIVSCALVSLCFCARVCRCGYMDVRLFVCVFAFWCKHLCEGVCE